MGYFEYLLNKQNDNQLVHRIIERVRVGWKTKYRKSFEEDRLLVFPSVTINSAPVIMAGYA